VTHERDIADCAQRVITVRDGLVKTDLRNEIQRDAQLMLDELGPAPP
jgi:putative ABC transport system ATP-binding protein